MRLLVVGGSGLVGSHVLAAARAAGHEAMGTYHGNALPGLVPLDAGDLPAFEALLDAHKPDVVVHAAGWTWVDGCEGDPDRAMEANCRQPVRMARVCAARDIRFAYFSSSYVFDGAGSPYEESSGTRPLNAYGRSKLQAERALAEVTAGKALVARVICVYGEESRRKNFAYQVLDAMRRGTSLLLPEDQRGNPTWAGDIAVAIISLLERSASGIWHLAGDNPECGRLEWARILTDAFSAAGIVAHQDFRLTGVTTLALGQKAARPLGAGMISRRLPYATLPTRLDVEVFRKMAGS